MSITINKLKCIGCGRCAEICPGNIIRMKSGRAYLKFPDSCWSCTSCMKECPADAISLTLPLAAGGRGGHLTAGRKGQTTRWHIVRSDGSEDVIITNTAEANQY